MKNLLSNIKNKKISLHVMRYVLHKRGFTLIEVVIAMGIFSIASVVISAVYLNANNLHQNTANFQRLQNEGRYIIEKIVRETRAREIDYSSIDPLQPQSQIKFLKDELGDEVAISLVNGNLIYSVGELSADLNAQDIEVSDVKFYVIPSTQNVWGEDPINDFQSRVTILLKLKNKVFNPDYQREILIQTTVSSKVYKR